MTIEAIDFGRLYRDHLAMSARTRKSASAWDARAAGMASSAMARRCRRQTPATGSGSARSASSRARSITASSRSPSRTSPAYPASGMAAEWR